jgi:hypothetical protein
MTGRHVIVPDWWRLDAPEASVLRQAHLFGPGEFDQDGEGLAAAALGCQLPKDRDVRDVIRKLERRGFLERFPADRPRWRCTSRGRWWLYGLEYGAEAAGMVRAELVNIERRLARARADVSIPPIPDPPQRDLPPAPPPRFEMRGVPMRVLAPIAAVLVLGLLTLFATAMGLLR